MAIMPIASPYRLSVDATWQTQFIRCRTQRVRSCFALLENHSLEHKVYIKSSRAESRDEPGPVLFRSLCSWSDYAHHDRIDVVGSGCALAITVTLSAYIVILSVHFVILSVVEG
jgi:hypothetical protein